ncbi:MAG: MBL fold metallo-hydrolase, partial [Dongiaceae bacterium]
MARRNKGKNRHHEKKQKPHRQRQESGVKPQKAAPSLHFTPGNDEVLYAPLGGAEHIGMNMYLYGHRGKWLMVDCGMGFAHEGLPGIDILLPDISFVEKNRGSFLGIVLTHGHEDHIGAIPYLIDRLQLPLYAAPFCAALIERKLEEVGLINQYPITRISTGQKFHVGPFELEYVRMAHSIPESQGLVINTGIGTLLHTGDWNLDPEPVIGYVTDEKRLRELGNAGVRALIGDSTKILVPGFSGSEGGL